MIVCSCNVLSDHDVRDAVCNATAELPRSAKQVYDCLGRSVECGRCARTIRTIIDEALGECARACHSGCRHNRIAAGELDAVRLDSVRLDSVRLDSVRLADGEFFLQAAE